MPKQRITKNMVVEAAFKIARQSGMEKVLVKSIADELGCSVQPIYSYCKNMDGLRENVGNKARGFIQEFIISHIDRNVSQYRQSLYSACERRTAYSENLYFAGTKKHFFPKRYI